MILNKQSKPFAIDVVRQDFPILASTVNGKPLVYLDNAATSQKPNTVIERINRYYREENANIHRGVHLLSQVATAAYEDAREKVASYINAQDSCECIFTRGTTEAINLVAQSWGAQNLKAGDEILLTQMEHHANIVPWQLLREKLGIVIKVAPILDNGELDCEALKSLIGDKTRLLALCHISNALGTINPARELIEYAHARGVPVLLDGAQSAAHLKVDMQELNCDFFTFSGHKVCGPTGIGVLYGKKALMEAMPPYQGGGDMIDRVTFEKTTFRGLPERFEAGTPNIAGAIGLATALDYVASMGHDALVEQEQALLAYATESLTALPGVHIYGTAPEKVAILSFTIDGIHPNDVGEILDADGVAVRTGHHCTMPLWQHFGLEGTIRASFAFYNTREEVDILVAALEKARKLLT